MLEITKDQQKIIADNSRFKVITAGRRWGKTHLALYDALLNHCWKRCRQRVWFVSPTYRQSKNIAWTILKEIVFTYPQIIRKINESELSIEFVNGSLMELKGADKEDSLRGVGLNHVILDEFAFMKKEAWTEVIRPALSDKKGTATFIGTPDGFNYFYDLYQQGLNQENGFKSWHFKSTDSPYIENEEIEKARIELDEKTFRQEYEATFETASGRIYFTFDRVSNHAEQEYVKQFPIKLLVDFNITPMSWLILQTLQRQDFVIEELVRRNTNTEFMAKLVGDLYGYDTYYQVYGDYTGSYRSTKSPSTDFDIIRQILPRCEFKLKPNPTVVDRINSMNSRVCNAKGERNVYINIKKCPELVKDFEQVVWMEGKREMDKSNMDRTHTSDALGYYIDFEYPIRGGVISKQW